MSSDIRILHGTLIELVGVMNESRRDVALIREAGIELDRAMLPLLVNIAQKGPIGIVQLADLVGRDHTTVSRQVAKLQTAGLVRRRISNSDKRSREAIITARGEKMTDALDIARKRLGKTVLANWSENDLKQLVKLMRRLENDLKVWYP